MFRMLRKMYGHKATIPDPEAFKDKVISLEKRIRKMN